MKAWELVAFDLDGARYCLYCCEKEGIDTDDVDINQGGPVFAVEDDYGTCDNCLQPIEDTL